jgi:hypothetical protein
MQNVYESKLMKKYLNSDIYNPGYPRHNLDVNKIFMCIGPTGSGKTNFLVHLIQTYADTFEEIIIYTADVHEEIYEMLNDQEGISVKKLNEIEPVDNLDKIKQKLIVFDDFITLSKKQMVALEDYAIRGRKMLCTQVYLTQNYYSVPIKIRNQVRYLVILKLTNKKNLSLIVQGLPIDIDVQTLKEIVIDATTDKFSVCILDLASSNPNKTIRKNFKQYYAIE